MRLERKYDIKVLRGKRARMGRKGRKRGGKQAINGVEEREVIKAIWLAAEQHCGKRLKAALKVWLPLREAQRALGRELEAKSAQSSASSKERLKAPCGASEGGRARCGTREGTL